MIVNGPSIGPWEPMVLNDLYVGKVALRAANGQYLSPQGGGGGAVRADGASAGSNEALDLISLGNNQVAFRASTGHFLSYDDSAPAPVMVATSWLSLGQDCIFTYTYL